MPTEVSIPCKIMREEGLKLPLLTPQSVSLSLLLWVPHHERGEAMIQKYLITASQIQKPFLLLALFSLLRPSYCHLELLWPSLQFFSWASAWTLTLLFDLQESLLSPCPVPLDLHRVTLHTEQGATVPAISALTLASCPAVFTSGPGPWPVALTSPLS